MNHTDAVHLQNQLATEKALRAEANRLVQYWKGEAFNLQEENARLLKCNQDFDALVSDIDPPDVLVHWLQDRKMLKLVTENNAGHVARIALAVAELEKFYAINATVHIDPEGIEHIERALEALK